MRLNSLRLENFRQHASTFIEFDRGLTGIIGPNGSGKTTILEAIAWALYGNPAARGSRESIRFNRAPPGAAVRVELSFELGNSRYRVVRKLTDAQVFLDDATEPIARTITAVGELLQRRLGMTRSEFFNTYFTGQKELNVMAAMGPTERAQFLSRVLGYERLRAAQALVREQRKLVSAESTGLRAGMPDPDAISRQVAEATERLQSARARAATADAHRVASAEIFSAIAPQWANAQQERERLQELMGELRVAESEESGLAGNLERLDRYLAETQVARAELEELRVRLAPYGDRLAELQQLDVLAREEGRRLTLMEAEREVVAELQRFAERRERIETAPVMERELIADVADARAVSEALDATLDARRTEWVRDKQDALTKRDQLRRDYGEVKLVREQLVSLGEEGICPTCTRPLGKNYRTVLEDLDEKLETLRVDGKYYANRLAQLEETPEDVRALEEERRAKITALQALERKLAKVQTAVHELNQIVSDVATKTLRHESIVRDLATIPAGYDAVRHDAVRAEVESLSPLDARAARQSALVEREPQLRREHRGLSDNLAALRTRLAALRERRDAIRFSEEDYVALRADHDRASAAARTTELAAATARGELSSAEQAMAVADRAKASLAETEKKLHVLLDDKRLHDELDRAFNDLRTDLNFQLRPELSELASKFLSELTDGRYADLQLDDQYNVVVLEDGAPKPVISGGEEDLANLVLRLAISQMIADRAGQSFSLLILDEVFGSLDESRRHNVMELLRRLQDQFEQVIVITHIEAVREGLDRVLSVSYNEERGSSEVTDTEGPFLLPGEIDDEFVYGDVSSDDEPDTRSAGEAAD